MNKLLPLIILLLLLGQSKGTKDALEKIQENALSIKNRKNNLIEKNFLQAKSLERAGLYEEAFILYKGINKSNPGVNRYFQPLKKYMKQIEAWDSLLVYTKAYAKAHNQDFYSQLELLDVYIWMEKKSKWQNIVLKFTKNKTTSEKSMKSILQHLLNNGKHDFAYECLVDYRELIRKKDFYSMEMGIFYGMKMAFSKATKEYLLFLQSHPNHLQTISDRIMAFPSDKNIIKEISSILLKDSSKLAQFILVDLRFKQKSYMEGYKILQNNNASPSMLLDYAKDLAAINEYMMSEKVLTDIINANIDGKIVTQAVFEIAKLFEAKMIIRSDLPLSGFYPHNPFFSSPYLPIQEKASISLESAMAIYDSLRISKKNAQAAFRLAEVQFRILGDLDGAYHLYQEAYKHGNSQSLRQDAGIGMINIHIAKGDLKVAKNICKNLQKEHPNVLQYSIKESQILFYEGKFDDTDNKLRTTIESVAKNHPTYNDVLDVLAILIGFRHHQKEFKVFADAQLNIQQNKRIESMEKLATLYNVNEIYIADMCRYQNAWLSFLQKDFDNMQLQLESIKHDTIFKEMAHIFQAEILDHMNKDIDNAINSYLEFLELYPNSIYYDDIRLRLREITS